jgi:polyketide synthase PksL
VSSFGFGGVNAHVVLEEYTARKSPKKHVPSFNPGEPFLILLSARDEPRLKERARSLLEVIEQKAFADGDLMNIAYTLQVGRDAMDQRLGMLVTSIGDLEAKLKAYIDADPKTPDVLFSGLWHGNARKNKDVAKVFEADDDLKTLIRTWTGSNNLSKLAALWVKGLNVDWRTLYSDERPKRISLPTYPFKKERYWFSEPSAGTRPKIQAFDTPETTVGPKARNVEVLDHEGIGGQAGIPENKTSPPFTGKVGDGPAILQTIRDILNNILMVEEGESIEADENFGDIGLTSLTLIEFVNELNHSLELDLSETIVLDYPELGLLADYIASLEPSLPGAPKSGDIEPELHGPLDSVLNDVLEGNVSVEEAARMIESY